MLKNSFKISLLIALLIVTFTTKSNAQQGTVIVNQDASIDRLLALKKSVNKSKSNYTIEVFKGNRSSAEKAHLNFKKDFSDWATRMEYDYPSYKIRVGNFRTRLEADRALVKIKKKYIAAFVLKPKKSKIEI